MAPAVVMMWAAIATAAVTTYSAIQQGQAQSASANYNAQIERQNQEAAAQQAAAAQAAQRQQQQRQLGLMSANYGASGVDPTTGSPLNVFADTVQQNTLSNLSTKYSYQMKGLGYGDQATLDSSQASNATTSGYLNAAGDAIGGASRAYGVQNGISPYGTGMGTPVSQ